MLFCKWGGIRPISNTTCCMKSKCFFSNSSSKKYSLSRSNFPPIATIVWWFLIGNFSFRIFYRLGRPNSVNIELLETVFDGNPMQTAEELTKQFKTSRTWIIRQHHELGKLSKRLKEFPINYLLLILFKESPSACHWRGDALSNLESLLLIKSGFSIIISKEIDNC